MTRIYPLLILAVFTGTSCFKEDQRLQPYNGNITVIAQPVQTHLSWFDFETGEILSSIAANQWQLGFECGSEGWHIITNSGDGWFIFDSGETAVSESVTMPSDLDHLFDLPGAFPDSTAVGNWVNITSHQYSNHVYLLSKRINEVFNTIRQVAFLSVNDTSYRFSYREMPDGVRDTVTIIKNDSTDFVYYDFEAKQQISFEPDKDKWDLAFGPYYDMATLFGVTIPYLVGGSYINEGNVEAALDSVNLFEDINAGFLAGYDFISQRDIPGYRWKSVTVDVSGGGSATYKVKEKYTYIFHTANDRYYKLKFLSYTHNGISGYPQFEYQQLK